MKYKITTKVGIISYLDRVTREYSFMEYKWDKTVYDYIIWSINKWNFNNPEKITIEELGANPFYLESLKNCYFLKKDISKDNEEDINIYNSLKENILGK